MIFFSLNASSSDLDRQFQLETIGCLRSLDNVDGLFGDSIASAYEKFFSSQSRFIYNDLLKTSSILSQSKIGYSKLIQDPEVLAQICRSTRTESLIRTKVLKEGSKYFFTLDWLHAPQMELVASEEFVLEGAQEGALFGKDFFSEPLETHLRLLIEKLPFIGIVTGRDDAVITVNLGASDKVKKGDTLVVGTLDEIKRHPILKTIVHWQITPTGRASVEAVEPSMVFAKLISEEPGRKVSRYQKIIRIESSPVEAEVGTEFKAGPALLSETKVDQPQLGWVSVTVDAGSSSRQFSASGSSVSNVGGGFALGTQAKSELWFTRSWFANLGFGYSSWTFSQQDSPTGVLSAASQNGGVSGSVFSFKLNLGYSYLLTSDMMGPRGWLKLGYKSSAYSLPVSTTEFTGPLSFNSVFLGLGGDVPVWGNWGATVDFSFRLFTLVSQTWVSGSAASASDVDLYFGTYYRLNPRTQVRAGFQVQAMGADFTGGTSLSQTMMTFGPALLYYF